jgi:Uma2 family endonuclease
MMAMGATTLLSFVAFEQLPSEPSKLELLDGELIRQPPAKLKQEKITHRLHGVLMPQVEVSGLGLGEAYVKMGYKLGSTTWLKPGVSITHLNQPSNDYLEGAPLLAVEVTSEFDTAEQMDRKVKTYLANGGKEVWVVYPKTQSVWVFREGRAEEFHGSLRSDIAPSLSVDLDQLFS